MTTYVEVPNAEGDPVQVCVTYTITEADPGCWRDADGNGHPGFSRCAEFVRATPADSWIESWIEAHWDEIEEEVLDDGMA
jgi:hypothetical protein